MISIIVPVYNVDKYLRRCVDSLLAQTYTDFEIILVDDGSTDSSGQICDQYAALDPRIRVIHKSNGGQSSARNCGLDVATGEYIGFVDSDDCVEPTYLEKLLSPLCEDNVDLSICGNQTISETGKSLTPTQVHNDYRLLTKEQLWHEVVANLNNAVWNKLYKAELIKGLRFPLEYTHGEDFIFNLQYLRKCNSGFLGTTPLYKYTKREGSITSRGFTPKRLSELAAKDLILDIVSGSMPQLIQIAEKYCFTARMSIIRALTKFESSCCHTDILVDCTKYLKENYSRVSSLLSYKQKIEYHLCCNCYSLYKVLIKIAGWI